MRTQEVRNCYVAIIASIHPRGSLISQEKADGSLYQEGAILSISIILPWAVSGMWLLRWSENQIRSTRLLSWSRFRDPLLLEMLGTVMEAVLVGIHIKHLLMQ